MHQIAIKTYARIQNRFAPHLGWPTHRGGGGSRVGHLSYWNNKIKEYNIEVKEKDSDKLVKSRSWTRNFEVLDFERTRNEATDPWKTWTCYTDGSKLGNHSGYGYLINRFGRTMYEGYDHMGPRASVHGRNQSNYHSSAYSYAAKRSNYFN
jgi:hypothetical protein